VSSRRAAVGIAAALAAVGCATPAMRDPTVKVVSRRLVAAPTDGVVWQWDASDKATVSADGTVTAMRNVDDSINYRLRETGGRAFDRASFDAFKWAAPFREWSERTLSEIMAERLGHAKVKHDSVSAWRYGPALAEWRDRWAADFMLISMFVDGRNTAGRTLLVTMGGGYLAVQRAIACAVQLADGRVVWCNMVTFASDLQQRDGAQVLADQLLLEVLADQSGAGLMGPGPAAATQPGDTR
jgi:hypothetical protein